MKKIGLMTWHHAENYGTAFQAYALKTLIEQQGYKVDLINYRRLNSAPISVPNIRLLILSQIRYLLKRIFKRKKKEFNFKKETFNDFYDSKFTYTHECKYNQDFEKLNSEYDGFVCGSDQIWGPNWFDGRYFLDFVKNPNKLIAYAPSIGVASITNSEVKYLMKGQISRFPNLSIREKNGCELIAELIDRKDIINALDPVIMLNSSDWEKLEEPFELKDKYALIFFLANNNENISISIKNAIAKGLKPVVLHCTQTDDTKFSNTDELSPCQLLSCIHGADYIYTDSFHIAVLSIVYHRQFITFQKQMSGNGKSQYKRITDLLTRLNIDGGIFRGRDSFDQIINYSNVEPLLSTQRSESLNYLMKSLDSLPGSDDSILNCCCKVDSCEGECTNDFEKYINGIESKSKRDFMISCQFSLKSKCYRCEKLNYSLLDNGRQPLFYRSLQNDLKSSDHDVYRKYYKNFYILSNLKKKF